MVKEFCTDRHRAAYRDQQQQRAIQAALDACQDVAASAAQAQAQLEGAMTLLQRFQRHPRDRRKKTT